jgi:hypothetical protein
MRGHQIGKFRDGIACCVPHRARLQYELADECGQIVNLLQAQRTRQQCRRIGIVNAQRTLVGLLIVGKSVKHFSSELLLDGPCLAATENLQQFFQPQVAPRHKVQPLQIG